MWKLHHNITSIALLNARPLRRWLMSIVILIPKDKGKPKVHRLRIIKTYESEYNLILKYFWPKEGMNKAEKNKWLGYNQMGGRHNMSSIEPTCLNEMITEVHRLTRTSLCIHQDDAKGCYDRIIRNHANLNNKKFLIPDNVRKIYCETHEKMEFKTQLHNSISKKAYTNTKSLPFHGAGQGAGNVGIEWTFISVPMIKVAEELTEGCTIKIPQGKSNMDDSYSWVRRRQASLCKQLQRANSKTLDRCTRTVNPNLG